MTQYKWQARRARIPEPIRAVAINNPLVHRICDEFAAGHIVTLEEALSQMVLNLSAQSDEMFRHLMNHTATSIPPLVIPKENFK